jgi:tetratricopeptide (TPR) repeat protein
VVIARPGSKKVLRSSEYIQHMTIEMEATSAPDHEDEFLSVRANVLAVEPAELKTAIAQWSAHAQEPLSTGVAAMYAKKYEEASRIIDQFVPIADPQAWDRYMALATAEGLQKKHESEAAIYKQARGAFPRDPIMLHNAAIMESYKGNSSEAEQLLGEALAIEEKTVGPDHRNTGIVSFTLGRTLLWSGRGRDAEPLLRKALAIEEKSRGENSSLAGLILFDLATISHGEQRYPEAEALYRRDLAILEKNHGREYRQVAVVLSYLGATYYDQGKYPEAETTWRRALAIAEDTDPNGPMTVSNMKALVAALKKLGKDEEANRLQERLQQLENRRGIERGK